ncbi:MAG: DUF1549 and DUF1553 domain-containing protein [Pirellulaceae bacterium]
MQRSPNSVVVALLALGLGIGVTTIGAEADQGLFFDAQAIQSSESTEQAPYQLHGADSRLQLLLTSQTQDSLRDVTREVEYSVEPPIATVDTTGFVKPLKNGTTTITAQLAEHRVQTTLQISGLDEIQPVNFPNQVVPIFTKLGCNGGGCHGKAAGQAGFKLSLLGFEPREDYEHLVNESRGRRLFPAVPDQSLLLLKAVNGAPHGGGQRLDVDSHEYRVLQRWIASGMPYGSDQDRHVTRIDLHPNQRRLLPEQTQQLRVIATYSDGTTEDITRTAQFDSNNHDLADVDPRGLVTLGTQPGDVAVMARYQGQVAVFRASIPLTTTLSAESLAQWPTPRNIVDEQVFAKLSTLGIPPSALCDDSSFVRRATLDICGRLPTEEEARQFVSSSDENKHEALIDRLLSSTDYAEAFAKKWSTILRNRRDGAGEQFETFAFYDWLRTSFHENKSYDLLVRELLTATGSIDSNPAVAWFHEVASTESRVEDAAQLFLGQRIQCARCHHHPFEKWSQTDYYQMSAFFSKIQKKEGPTPESPIFVSRIGGASAQHPKSGKSLSPAGLDGDEVSFLPVEDPREKLVDWMVAPANPFFARALANRYWKHFFATGLVEPEDDMRVTNPATNPALLDALANDFVQSGYDLKALIRLICTSNTYRLAAEANVTNLGDQHSYSRFYPKRLSAEVLLDAIDQVTQSSTSFAGMPAGTRAVNLPDSSFASYFLDVFGRPAATTSCECERSQEATLAQSLHLLNSQEVQTRLSADSSRPAAMAASSQELAELIDQLYWSALSRPPKDDELKTAIEYISKRADRRREAFEDLVWAMINSKEFLFNH